MPALRLNAISTVGAVIIVAILGGVLATTRCRQGAVALIALSALSTMLAPTPYHVSARAGAGKARSHSPKVEVANLVTGSEQSCLSPLRHSSGRRLSPRTDFQPVNGAPARSDLISNT